MASSHLVMKRYAMMRELASEMVPPVSVASVKSCGTFL